MFELRLAPILSIPAVRLLLAGRRRDAIRTHAYIVALRRGWL